MNILVTGTSGFVGRNLLEFLKKKMLTRDQVFCLSGETTAEGYCYNFASIPNIKWDAVIHLGAVTPKGNGIQSAMDYAQNITTTQSLIEHLSEPPMKFIFCSTTSVYETISGVISEKSALQFKDTYGLSKLFCERLLEEWSQKNGVCLQILRFGPIYGPGEERYKKLVGTFLRQAMRGEPIHIYSDGTEKRSMVYVGDVCEKIWKAIELKRYEDPINITNNRAITILEIAQMACQITESNSKIIIENRGELRTEVYNNERMQQILGCLNVSYKQGMQQLYQYFKGRGNI